MQKCSVNLHHSCTAYSNLICRLRLMLKTVYDHCHLLQPLSTCSQQRQNNCFHMIRSWKQCFIWLCGTCLDWTGSVLMCFHHTILHVCSSSISTDSTDSGPSRLLCYVLLFLGLLLTHIVHTVNCFAFPTSADETPDNLPFPDGKEVSPEIIVETLPGNCCRKLEIQFTPINL